MRADCIAVVGEARFRIDGATALARYRREAADISAGCRDCGGEWVGTQPVRLGVDQEVSWPRSAVRAFAHLHYRPIGRDAMSETRASLAGSALQASARSDTLILRAVRV